MTERTIKRTSLAELRRMADRKEIGPLPKPAHVEDEEETLGPEFWARAELVEPKGRRSVHLKLEADVFEFFHAASGGKGHLTKMQNVLKAYAEAHRKG